MKVYLSGPITGLTPKEASDWRDHAAQRLVNEGNFTVRDPLRGTARRFPKRKKFVYKNYPDVPDMSGRAFVMRDLHDTLDSDAVLCNVLGAKIVSIGSVCEIAWAMLHRKITILVMEDRGNVHDHEFLKECCLVFNDLDLAIDYLLSCGGEAADDEEGD
jgi:hypothetical protein